MAIIYSLPCFCLKWGRQQQGQCGHAPSSPRDTLPLVDCNRKLNLLSFFLRGKVILVLEKINSPPEEMNQVLSGARPHQWLCEEKSFCAPSLRWLRHLVRLGSPL